MGWFTTVVQLFLLVHVLHKLTAYWKIRRGLVLLLISWIIMLNFDNKFNVRFFLMFRLSEIGVSETRIFSAISYIKLELSDESNTSGL